MPAGNRFGLIYVDLACSRTPMYISGVTHHGKMPRITTSATVNFRSRLRWSVAHAGAFAKPSVEG